MMGHAFRVAAYNKQTNSKRLTPAQRRRSQKKLGHFLGKRKVTTIRTVKGPSN